MKWDEDARVTVPQLPEFTPVDAACTPQSDLRGGNPGPAPTWLASPSVHLFSW